MQANQIVSEMVVEALVRQAEVLSERTGQPFEEAFASVLDTPAGHRLRELADGPHRHEKATEWQAGLLEERVRREWAKGEEASAKYGALLEDDLIRLKGQTFTGTARV